MHVLVASQDRMTVRLFERLLQEEHSDWTVTVVHRPYVNTDIDQFVAGLLAMNLDLLIVQEYDGLLMKLMTTTPHPFPIIGCTSYCTPDFVRRLRDANIIPVVVPWSIDEMVELITATAALQR